MLSRNFFPGQLALSANMFSHRGKHYKVVNLVMHYDLNTFLPVVFDEVGKVDAQVQSSVLEEANSMPTHLDEGYPKLRGEWMVYGRCHSKGLSENGHGAVTVSFAGMEKSLAVFGPRTWRMTLAGSYEMSEPQPIDSLPIVYEYSYGHKKYALNPVGMDSDKGLPQIEYPGDIIVSRDDAPSKPAGLTAIQMDWMPRAGFRGTYDKKWVNSVRPALPQDMSWEYFSAAPSDQRLSSGFFKGDEDFQLFGFKENGFVQGRLPNYKTRLFYTHLSSRRLNEVKANLDTVLFFPEIDMVRMIWRGVIEVQDPVGSGISCILAAYESPAESDRDLSYYQNDFDWRYDESMYDPLYVNLVTGPLIPKTHISAQRIIFGRAFDSVKDNPVAQNMAARQERIEKQLSQGGGAMDAMDNMADKIEARSNDFYKTGRLEGGETGAATRQTMRAAREEMERSSEPFKKSVEAREAAKAEGDRSQGFQVSIDTFPAETKKMVERVEAIIPRYITSPARVNADDLVKRKLAAVRTIMDDFTQNKTLEASLEMRNNLRQELAAKTEALADLPSQTRDEKLYAIRENLESLEQKIDNLMHGTPEPTEPLPRIPDVNKVMGEYLGKEKGDSAAQKVKDLVAGMPDGMFESLPDEKRMGIMMGIEQLESGNLVGDGASADIPSPAGTFFSGYLMTADTMENGLSPHGDEEETLKAQERFVARHRAGERLFKDEDLACFDLRGMDFSGTTFDSCYMEQMKLDDANLSGCEFPNCVFVRSSLVNANCQGADFREANIGGSLFEKTNLSDARFGGEIYMRGVNFNHAKFGAVSVFRNMSMSECNFSHAVMPNSRWDEVTLNTCNFTGTMMEGARFHLINMIFGALNDAKLTRAQFERCNITNTTMDGVDFTGTHFDSTAFSGLNVDPNHPAIFDACDFDGSSLSHADFSGSSFRGAKLLKVSTVSANFEGCCFDDAVMDGTLMLANNLKHASFHRVNAPSVSFQDANIKNASFKEANLWGSDFARSTMGWH